MANPGLPLVILICFDLAPVRIQRHVFFAYARFLELSRVQARDLWMSNCHDDDGAGIHFPIVLFRHGLYIWEGKEKDTPCYEGFQPFLIRRSF